MSNLEKAIQKVLKELEEGRKLDILDPAFQKQSDFIRHPARRKALWCTRRASKSYTGGLAMIQAAIDHPGVNILYIGLTRLSAKSIIWKDILKRINNEKQIDFTFNHTELTATHPNSSIIYVTGVDAEEDEMQKLLGKKWKLVVIDEAQSFTIDLRALVYGILGPAMVDEEGTIILSGTAGNITQGLFFDITTGKEAGWNLFEWSALDNPYVARQWRAELEDIATNRPLFMDTALYKQWFLNEWCIDENARVYKYTDRNNSSALPLDLSDWSYVLGLDLAHSPDSTAFVVSAYNVASPMLYFVYAYKETEMDLTAVAEKVKALERRYPFEVKIVDGAAKQAVSELNNRHGLGLIPADKIGKADFIKIFNDELVQRKIQYLPATLPLQEELNTLIWETDANGNVKEPRREHPAIHNDLCDAMLYNWRYCYSYLFKPADPFLDMSKQENWEPAHIKKLQEKIKREQNPEEYPLGEWDQSWDDF